MSSEYITPIMAKRLSVMLTERGIQHVFKFLYSNDNKDKVNSIECFDPILKKEFTINAYDYIGDQEWMDRKPIYAIHELWVAAELGAQEQTAEDIRDLQTDPPY